ncbi:hypothetical protein AGABI1DRAFT_116834 [Agaricus bisporus var. burnettii JB137-S8]|nr:uncharacterized protein AGABI1DRAFT_116831 [Agaricus bisporus var. burnettii JB137-S8]XP_007335064.1 uncharacterized protein AGABI1DRAFT_116834 [Agaricus bisporus var. burnettii JB137-S8]EKM74297.1 hypothetical protein AGABI1DRAFT_116831 [Agaricus bisporus var. burnettii JB137-S8]EKM74299.1 hypothetical protein AGABI1DRAFT_116834 [Agaricus bisporus var. burnettii JB137-S8]
MEARGCTEIFPYGRFEDGESNNYYAPPDYPEVELPELGTLPFPPVELPTYSDPLVDVGPGATTA